MLYNPNRSLYTIVLALTLTLFLCCRQAQAQRRSGLNADGDLLSGSSAGSSGGGYLPTEGWSVSLNAGFEAPQGDLKADYKGAPTFGATVARRLNHFIFSATVDYRQLKPKQAVSEADPDQPGLGTVTIGNFNGLGLYVGAAYEFLLTPGASIYAGLNGGYIYSSTNVEVESMGFSTSASSSTQVPYFGPKLGFNFAVGNNVSVGIQGRYSLSVTGVSANSRTGAYVTPGYGSVAGNLFLTYSF